MGTQDITLMKALTAKMGWIEERQKVIAQNIANADTPGYRPQDLESIDFKNLLKSSTSSVSIGSSGLATTNGQHIGSGSSSSRSTRFTEKQEKNPYEVSPVGNAVVLEEQLLKMNENMTDHRLITNLYEKNIGMLKASLKSQ